ncbi:MAG: hypothetical protein ACYTBZ_24970 [Planctomycetota bacterium]
MESSIEGVRISKKQKALVPHKTEKREKIKRIILEIAIGLFCALIGTLTYTWIDKFL